MQQKDGKLEVNFLNLTASVLKVVKCELVNCVIFFK